jgi:hypothetical protein
MKITNYKQNLLAAALIGAGILTRAAARELNLPLRVGWAGIRQP